MRRWVLPFSVILLVLAYNLTCFAADANTCDLIVKIHAFVAQSNAEAMYRSPADARKKALADLKEKYKASVEKLKALAEKDKGAAKEVRDALVKFQANLDGCSACEHDFRNLSIDLTEFENCRKRSCDPLNAARRVIFEKAVACKKVK